MCVGVLRTDCIVTWLDCDFFLSHFVSKSLRVSMGESCSTGFSLTDRYTVSVYSDGAQQQRRSQPALYNAMLAGKKSIRHLAAWCDLWLCKGGCCLHSNNILCKHSVLRVHSVWCAITGLECTESAANYMIYFSLKPYLVQRKWIFLLHFLLLTTLF